MLPKKETSAEASALNFSKWNRSESSINELSMFVSFAGFNAYFAFPLNYEQLVLFLGFGNLSANFIML